MTTITLGKTAAGNPVSLHLDKANRHGLITGATGTGKSRALQLLAEAFSEAGVPVFMSDIKGDLSGLASPGDEDGGAARRAAALSLPWSPRSYPVRFWDLMGQTGLAMRTSIQDMGRMLTTNMLECTDAQDRAIGGVFAWTKDMRQSRPPVLDLEMLATYLEELADLEDADDRRYGGVTASTARVLYGKIERIEAQGGNSLFGEPALDILDLLATTEDGRGVINMLDATDLMERPRLYGTWLTFLLMRLFRALPEVGDLDKPKLVFFFDEAHLLFKNASTELLDEIERMVRLIRSRGVGVYFVTQSPADVPASVLAQLGNRIQFALRAFTPRDIAAVRKIAETYRLAASKTPKAARQAVVDAITTMGVGEALVSPLQPDGTPMPVARVVMAPPRSSMGRLSETEHRAITEADPLRDKYGVQYEGVMAEWSLWQRTYPAEFDLFHQQFLARQQATEAAPVAETARTMRDTLMECAMARIDDLRIRLGV
jgi:DNA helicase HerA-like ATPase